MREKGGSFGIALTIPCRNHDDLSQLNQPVAGMTDDGEP